MGERRHPAEVTAERLLDHLERWFDSTDGELRDEISHVRHWLLTIAEEVMDPITSRTPVARIALRAREGTDG